MAYRSVFPFSAWVALAWFAFPGAARADMTKAQCVEANTHGQDLRRDGKLSEARVQLQACGDPACPAIVRADCTRRLDELQAAQPTVAFEVKDGSGTDITAVKISVDGKPLVDHLDGNAIPVDIGQHAFTFTVEGQPPVTRNIVLTEGEKGRREVVLLGTPPSASAAAPAAATSPGGEPTAHASKMPTQKIVGLAAAGAGVAGLAVGAVFGIMTISQKNQQQNACADTATCTTAGHAQALDAHSTGMTDSTISTIGFIAGGALLAGGAVLFFTARPPASTSTGLVVTPSVGPLGGGMTLSGAF